MASAKAMAKIAIVCTFDADSGFLPIDFTAEEPIQPIEIAGKIVPAAIEATVAHKRIESISILFLLINNYKFSDLYVLRFREPLCVKKLKPV